MSIFLWMQIKCYANLDFLFSMQMLFTMMQMRNVHMMHMLWMSVWWYAMMQMYPCGYAVIRMSLWCMPWCECPHGACRDANVPLVQAMMRMFPYRYAMNVNALLWVCNEANAPLMHAIMCMSAWEYVMMRMFPQEYVVMQMFTCRCIMMQMSLYRHAMMQMPPCEYTMPRMLWCKHNLFKNSLYFQNEASTTPETTIFSRLDLLFMKSHLPFDLRLPKKLVITVRNLRMGYRFEIWWSGSKDLFSQFGWAKRDGTFSRPF